VGKTTLLLGQIYGDILRGEGVGLCDPHGDLADSVLRLIPRHRTNDVVIFDAADPTHAIAFNPLACPDLSRIDQVTSAAVSALKKLHDSWGPRLENLLRNAVHATVEQQGTLLTLLRLLTDDAFRERLVPRITDEVVRAFWQQEFASWTRPYRIEAVAAITNKIQPFLTNTSVRAIVSQADRSLNIRRLMDDGKILIANLSKGKIGEDNSALLGAFLVTAIQQAAMTRADVPEESRRDFYLYIDEFQNFVTTSFETILSEARKYRLNLTVSHQYRAQLTDTTAAAIAGNVGTIVSFAVGSDDAEWIARAIGTQPGHVSAHDLANLPKFTAYVRPLVDGVPTGPFSVTTCPPPAATDDRSDIILAHSRRQFSRPREPTPPAVESRP
jgi:type IV secretory pathway TraG/TraD family ATPase VirD4